MKKFSKKLFCLMLVAIMVATAIPFGALAAPCGEDHSEHPELWRYDSADASMRTATTHPLRCKTEDCDWTGGAYHDFGADGKCTVCGYESNPTYYLNVTGALGTHTKEFDSGLPGLTFAEALNWVGLDAASLNIHATGTHLGEGYYYQDAYDAASHTRTITITKDEHDMMLVGPTKDRSKHTLKCKIGSCAYTSEEAHSYSTTTGLCACGEKNPAFAKAYAVSVKTEGGIQVAGGTSKNMTESAAEALKTANSAAIKSFIETVYPTVAADLTDNNLNGATVAVDHEKASILITLKSFGGSSSGTTPTPANQILVIFDDGNTRTINRDTNVGTWYFASSNLGLSNTWGTKQAILKIEDANGFRYVTWGSKDSDAYIKQTDSTVWVLGNNKTVTIYYLKSSTSNPTTTNAHATKKYEFNTQLGTLPDLPAGYSAWYVDGVQLTENTVYDWESDYVYAYPGKGDGDGRVHLFIYNNNKELMKNVDVTDNVQANGLITRDGLVKTIEYQTGRKNPTLAGLFTESGWAYYLNNNKSTRYAQTSVSVGVAGERQGTQNLYVVLTNVSGGSNADTSNPKTGDTAMIGTAAIVMALATVGMGIAFYMKKKELF